MKKTGERIFLGGGGNEIDAKPLDERFVQTINNLGLMGIAYIPLAMRQEKFVGAFQWFEPQFKDKVQKLEMWTDLSEISLRDLHRIGALYIGGGDTIRLMERIHSSGFVPTLRQFIAEQGIVYGGSAGAIILGKDLRTAPESGKYNLSDYSGLNLLSGYSVACHYTPDQRQHYKDLGKNIDTPILALSEKSGVVIGDGETQVVGNGEVALFANDTDIDIIGAGTIRLS